MSLTNEELVKVRELIADGTGTFEEGEKITYSLKYALNLTTKDPASAAGFEFLSAPRIFPSSIPNKDLIKINEGDINSDGKDSNDNLVDITAPYDTVKQYKIIDPITNKVSNKNVNDILGTSFSSIASVWSNKAEEIPDENTFSTGTVYRHWFHDYNTSPYNEVLEPANNWKGIRLAYKRATVGEIVQEGHADFVPHISLYLGVPLKAIPDSSWAGGTGDSISYEHAKDKGRYLLGLLGLSNTFKTRILKNDYTTIKIDTASANEGDTWFTNPSYGLLSLYGIKDTKESGSAGIGDSAGTNTPRISFCRYIGGTATFSGGSSVTVGGVGEDAPTNGAKGDLFYDIDDPKLQINKDGTSNGWVKVGGESWTENESDIYRSSGNVGIGTENPKAKLNVAGKLNDTNNTIPSNYGGDSTTTCVLGHGRDTGGDDYWGLNIGTIWKGASYLQACQTSGTFNLLLNPKGGNVGISNESPDYKLDINIGTEPVRIKGGGSGTTQLILDSDYNNYWSEFRTSHNWDTYRSSTDTYTSSSAGTTMFLNYYSAGNVSICGGGGGTCQVGGYGDANSNVKLEVFNGNINKKSIGPEVQLLSQDGEDGWILNGNVSTDLRAGRFRIITKENNNHHQSDKFTIKRNGNVGIDNSNPLFKLDINIGTEPVRIKGGESGPQLILDRDNDNYWSEFRSSHHWDTYQSSTDTYTKASAGTTMYLNDYSAGDVSICNGGGTCRIGTCVVDGILQVGDIELGYTNEINNWGGPIHLQYRTSHNIMLCNGGGYVGIDCDPEYHLHAHGDIMADGGWLRTTGNHGFYSQTHGRGIYFTDSNWLRCWGSFAFYNHTGVSLNWNGYYFDENYSYRSWNGTSTISIECAEGIVANWFGAQSDRRIKKNIEDIDDGDALELLRKIPVRYYNYKDEVRRGSQKVSGFIAQEVKEVFPIAVSIGPNTTPIPNILKKITNEVWEEITDSSENKWLLKKFDLIDSSGVILPADISGGKSYKFSMQDEINKNGDEEIILSDSSGNFIFKKKWKYLFLYGICVDDFLIVDKNKIFAINFSASQEIDRIQQAEKTKLEEQTSKLEEQTLKLKEASNSVAETKLAVAETKLAVAETKLAVAETKLAVAEAKITELEAENSTLNVDIAAIKAHLGL